MLPNSHAYSKENSIAYGAGYFFPQYYYSSSSPDRSLFSLLHLSMLYLRTLQAAQPVPCKLLIHHFLRCSNAEKTMD